MHRVSSSTVPEVTMKQIIESAVHLPKGAVKALEHLLNAERTFIFIPLTRGGSDREFYRTLNPESGSSVVICLTENLEEMEYYLQLGTFFHQRGVVVPKFLYSSLNEGLVIMEDAGSCSLYDAERETESDEETISRYTSVLEKLLHLQSLEWSSGDWLSRRPFDYHMLRWETSYFLERFLGGVMGYDLVDDEHLSSEFHRLAEAVSQEKPFPMHRDFQSQNIYLRNGKVFFLDFQGARTGPLFYDVASLLADPYTHHRREIRDALFIRYCEMAESLRLISESISTMKERYTRASMQRLMQALGAYGFLGLVKGKRTFLQHIRPALSLLLETVNGTRNFPRIADVVRKAHNDAEERDDIP